MSNIERVLLVADNNFIHLKMMAEIQYSSNSESNSANVPEWRNNYYEITERWHINNNTIIVTKPND